MSCIVHARSVLPSSSSSSHSVWGTDNTSGVVGTASGCSATIAGARQDWRVVHSPESMILWANKLDGTRVRQERSTDQGRERSKKCVVNITELRKKPLS